MGPAAMKGFAALPLHRVALYAMVTCTHTALFIEAHKGLPVVSVTPIEMPVDKDVNAGLFKLNMLYGFVLITR